MRKKIFLEMLLFKISVEFMLYSKKNTPPSMNPIFRGKIFLALILFLSLDLSGAYVLTADEPRFEPPPPSIEVLFKVRTIESDEHTTDALIRFTEQYYRSGSVITILVRTSEAETPAVSYKIAMERKAHLKDLILDAGVPEDSIMEIPGLVIPGTSQMNDRAEIKMHRSRSSALLHFKENLIEAIEYRNQWQKQFPGWNGEPAKVIPAIPGGSASDSGWFSFFITLIWLPIAGVLGFILYDIFKKTKFKKHRITDEIRRRLNELVGKASAWDPINKINTSEYSVEDSARMRNPAESEISPEIKNKKTVNDNPDTIEEKSIFQWRKSEMSEEKHDKHSRGIDAFLSKEYRGKELSEIMKSPIHALNGLDPRHTRLLEEGFGIRTVEDLSGLKYFEIARALSILSRHEK